MAVRTGRSYPPPPTARGRRIIGVVVLVVSVLGVVIAGLDAAGVVPTPGYQVLFVGASVTEGYYASNGEHAYPAVTISDLEDRGAVVDSIVVGHAGSGTAQVLKWRLQATPDAMVLQIATNDFGRNITLDRYVANYRAILRRLRLLGPRARLLCLGEWRNPAEVNKAGVTGAEFNAVTERACADFGGHFVNLGPIYLNAKNHGPRGRETAFGRADYFHPNNRGHAAIAGLVVRSLGQVPTSWGL